MKDPGFVEAAGAKAAEGTIITCPCIPAEDPAVGRLRRGLRGRVRRRPGHLRRRGLRRGEHLPRRHRRGRSTTARTMLEFVNDYDEAGITKQLKFDETGEPADVARLRLQGRGRRDRLRPGDRADAVDRRHVERDSCGRGGMLPGRSRARLTGRGGPVNFDFLFNNFAELTITGLALGADLRPDRPRLHDGLRRPAADQLRALRSLHVRHLRRAVDRDAPSAATATSSRRRGDRASCSPRWSRRWPSRRPSPCSSRRVAYRPLIKRNAPKLIALISAIGASFVLAELMGLRDRDRRLVRPRRRPRASTSAGARDNREHADASSSRQGLFTIGDYTVTDDRRARHRLGAS